MIVENVNCDKMYSELNLKLKRKLRFFILCIDIYL